MDHIRLANETDWDAVTHAGNEQLAKHLWNHFEQLFTFLRFPGLDATNWRPEQAMHVGVILRKVRGGNDVWKRARRRWRITSDTPGRVVPCYAGLKELAGSRQSPKQLSRKR